MSNVAREEKGEKTQIILSLLDSVERDGGQSQRSLAADLGIALGLTNAYLKRCVKKGYVKIRQVPLNRYNYYLTPRGFAAKSRLTTEYLFSSLDFFRRARRDCAMMLASCRARGWQRVVLWGTGDLSEIAMLSAAEADVTIVGIVAPNLDVRRCAGQAVVADLSQAVALASPLGIDAILITDVRTPQQSFQAAQSAAAQHGLAPERVVALELLAIRPGHTNENPVVGKAAR